MAKRIREKTIARQKSKDTRPFATVSDIGIGLTKVALVLNLIRGKKVDEALAILDATPNGAAPYLTKLVNSAIANAEHNKGLNRSDLYIAECYGTQGPSVKRLNIRARGRADKLYKRSSNLTVILDQIKA
jgi:large subunit ribosomal protein L22